MTATPLRLVPIDRDNWRAAYALRPHPEQEGFVAPNAYSLVEARYETEMVPKLALAGEVPVGFVMYGVDPQDDRLWLVRMMVGAEHQGRGHGRRLLEATIRHLRDAYGPHPIRLGFVPGNAVAERLYLACGFRPTGTMIDGEHILELPASTVPASPGDDRSAAPPADEPATAGSDPA